jgi:hypothetical protein
LSPNITIIFARACLRVEQMEQMLEAARTAHATRDEVEAAVAAAWRHIAIYPTVVIWLYM